MRFARVGLKPNRGLYTHFGQGQPRFSVIVVKIVYCVVRKGELAISKEKGRVPRYRLVKKLHRFDMIFPSFAKG